VPRLTEIDEPGVVHIGRSIITATSAMPADAKAPVDATANLAPLLGTWVDAQRDTDRLATVVVGERSGEMRVRLHGSPMDEPMDRRETEAIPYVVTGMTTGRRAPHGVHAR
jgi:hypothetical protein